MDVTSKNNTYVRTDILRDLGPHPLTGLPVLVKASKPGATGRYGHYIQHGYGTFAKSKRKSVSKPQFSSIPSHLDPQTLSMQDAMMLLELPRLVGTTATGGTVTALYNSGGPRVIRTEVVGDKVARQIAPLPDDPAVFTVTLEEALALKWRAYNPPPPQPATPPREPPLAKELRIPIGSLVRVGRYGPSLVAGALRYSWHIQGTGVVIKDTGRDRVELLYTCRHSGETMTKRVLREAIVPMEIDTTGDEQ